jgi:hypothetical protein
MSPNSAALPLEAREAAGRLLWQRLLAEPPVDDDSPATESEAKDGGVASEDEAA